MADQRILYTERMVGAGHPTLADTLNRLSLVEHNTDGTHDTTKVAPASKGVTNGDSHNHTGGAGAQLDHANLLNKGTNTHAQIDSALTASAAHISNINNPHNVTAEQVGLGNVTNAAQVLRTEMGAASGVATLGADGRVPSGQLPSYVDSVNSKTGVVVLSSADVGADPSGTASGLIATHESTYNHGLLHSPVTVTDSSSINLTLTGQDVTADAIFGTTSGTVCQGDDSRLSDARTPTSHDNTYHSETYITGSALTGLLDETAHDLLDHTGLTGIPAQYTDEMAQDAVGAAIAAGTQTGITVSYDDVSNKIDFTVTSSVADGDKGDITVSNSGATWTVDSVDGNLDFLGTGARIRGDFFNPTVANRVMFQNSVANQGGVVGVIPNGTGVGSGWRAYSTSDPANSAALALVSSSTQVQISSEAYGTGTPLPMTFHTGGSRRLSLATDGTFTSVSGAIGYGPGAGGTVTQATSKSTVVTLNKPCGQITMNNAALASKDTVNFQFNNNLITATDGLLVTPSNSYNYDAECVYTGEGYSGIRVTNTSGGSLSEALVINFQVIKGATS